MNKRDYLVGKLVDGATALNEFFEQITKDSSLNPADVGRALASKYELTDQQQKNLEVITSRVITAKGIVDYLKEKFGVDENGVTTESHELHQYMRGDVPDRDFYAQLNTFTICLEFKP